jgi:predicted RNase H-like HicB family nuclease
MTTANNAAAADPAQDVGSLGLTVVFRPVPAENIVVAECLEIPGCVSQGKTQEEAHKNIEDAMRLCLSVMFEDRLREAMNSRTEPVDYTGITKQETFRVRAVPELEYA